MSWSSRLKNSGHHHSNYDGRPKSGKINFLLWFLIWNVQFDIERNKFKIGFSKGFFCEWEWIIFQMNDIAVVQVFLRIVLELELEVLAKNHIFLLNISKIFSAIWYVFSSPSMTHGPAIKKNIFFLLLIKFSIITKLLSFLGKFKYK